MTIKNESKKVQSEFNQFLQFKLRFSKFTERKFFTH